MSWDIEIMTFGESQYFDVSLSKSRDNGNTASIISIVRCLPSPPSPFLWAAGSDRASSQIIDVTVHLVGDDSSTPQVVFFWSLSHLREGSSFTQGPSKPSNLCLFISRPLFSSRWAHFLPPMIQFWAVNVPCQGGQGWAVPGSSLHFPLLLAALEELLEQGNSPILPGTALDIPC